MDGHRPLKEPYLRSLGSYATLLCWLACKLFLSRDLVDSTARLNQLFVVSSFFPGEGVHP